MGVFYLYICLFNFPHAENKWQWYNKMGPEPIVINGVIASLWPNWGWKTSLPFRIWGPKSFQWVFLNENIQPKQRNRAIIQRCVRYPFSDGMISWATRRLGKVQPWMFLSEGSDRISGDQISGWNFTPIESNGPHLWVGYTPLILASWCSLCPKISPLKGGGFDSFFNMRELGQGILFARGFVDKGLYLQGAEFYLALANRCFGVAWGVEIQ